MVYWDIPDKCPNCGTSWKEELIPEKYQEDYEGTHWGLQIGVEYGYPSLEQYDGVSEWQCPKCLARFGRWTGQQLKEGELESRYGERGVIKSRRKKHGKT